VDDELVGLLVKRSGSLETSNVGAVRQLSHTEAAVHALARNDTLLHPVRELVGSGTAANGSEEETVVHTESRPEAGVKQTNELHALGEHFDRLVLDAVDQRADLGHGALTELLFGEIVDIGHVEDWVTRNLDHEFLLEQEVPFTAML